MAPGRARSDEHAVMTPAATSARTLVRLPVRTKARTQTPIPPNCHFATTPSCRSRSNDMRNATAPADTTMPAALGAVKKPLARTTSAPATVELRMMVLLVGTNGCPDIYDAATAKPDSVPATCTVSRPAGAPHTGSLVAPRTVAQLAA